MALAEAMLLSHASAAPGAALPPPLAIDLDAFDAQKKMMTLPNGEVLAYIDMGNASGTPVVLIHGYTDNRANRNVVTAGWTSPMTSS